MATMTIPAMVMSDPASSPLPHLLFTCLPPHHWEIPPYSSNVVIVLSQQQYRRRSSTIIVVLSLGYCFSLSDFLCLLHCLDNFETAAIQDVIQMASGVGFVDDAPLKRFFSVRVRHQKINTSIKYVRRVCYARRRTSVMKFFFWVQETFLCLILV